LALSKRPGKAADAANGSGPKIPNFESLSLQDIEFCYLGANTSLSSPLAEKPLAANCRGNGERIALAGNNINDERKRQVSRTTTHVFENGGYDGYRLRRRL
jgi:hypothetical protein